MFSSHTGTYNSGLMAVQCSLKIVFFLLACFGVLDARLKLCTNTDDVGHIPHICLEFEFSQSDSWEYCNFQSHFQCRHPVETAFDLLKGRERLFLNSYRLLVYVLAHIYAEF